jgi:hypothetical protein
LLSKSKDCFYNSKIFYESKLVCEEPLSVSKLDLSVSNYYESYLAMFKYSLSAFYTGAGNELSGNLSEI